MSPRSITAEPIDVAELLAEVQHPGCGGTAVFIGSVRRGPEDGPVVAIDYSAYEAMAADEFDRILRETEARWPGATCRGQHRIGRVKAGEASVAVVVATPHRAEAFEACRHVIDEVKRRLPIWKKELLDDGTQRWREGEG